MQAVAPVDCLAHLPGPPGKGNRGAASLHDGRLLAYAAASAVLVVDAQNMTVATTLAGAHRQAAVSALAWHPGGGAREPRAAAQLRLATGDEEGRVMVWNVNTGAVIAALEDPWGSAFGATGARRPEGAPNGRPPVVGLQWATAAPSVLAVLLAPCIILLWDYRTGSAIWKKDFGSGPGAEAFTSLQVDPLDRRRLVLCGSKGSFIVLCLISPAANRVRYQQYQVDIGAGGTLRCAFSGTQDLLFLLLQREIIVFDLEYGQPAASTPVPASRAPLEDLLGCYGHAAAGKLLRDGGIDVLYCSHRDGSLSVWQRHPRLLTFGCLGASKLLPPAPKFGTAPTMLALAAGLWHGLEDQGQQQQQRGPSAQHVQSASDLVSFGSGWGEAGTGNDGSTPQQRVTQQPGGSGGCCVLLMGAASDGRVWQWQAPLLEGTLPESKPAALPPPPKPELLGLLHTLPQRVTLFCACPLPVPLPGASGAVTAVAAATAAGTIEILAVQQGPLLPLHLSASASLAAHSGPVQGLRWLGSTPRLVSFSSEKATQGFKNLLLITDVRNRLSLPVREGSNDPAPLVGVRASPSGRYLLVLFRGAPSEIWSVGAGSQPVRLRQVDLQFTAVEWLGLEGSTRAGSDGSAAWAPWAASPRAAERAATGYAFQGGQQQAGDEPSEERLAFSLADGRAGVLGIRGRRISDTRPRRPAWQPLANGDFRAVAIGSWGPSLLLGDGEGMLAHWDTASGKCSVLETGLGRVYKLYTSPPPAEALYPRLPGPSAVAVRVAALFASGVFAVYDLDQQGELWATHITGTAAAARIGRVTDVEWLQLPSPVGGGAVLAASLEDGSLGLFDTVHTADVRPRRNRMTRYRALLHTPPPAAASAAADGSASPTSMPWGLASGPPVAAPPLLPRAWVLLLRLLLQRGLPEACFRELGALAASVSRSGGPGGMAGPAEVAGGTVVDTEMALERLEDEIWAHLPRSCQAAWDSLLAQRDQAEGQEAPGQEPSLAQLLESFGDSAAGRGGGGAGLDPAAVATGAQQQEESRPSFDGSAVRDEAAAAALGLTGRSSSATVPGVPGGAPRRRDEVKRTFKSLRGAFKGMAKDVASASKSQLRSLAGGGRAQQPLWAAVAGISDGYELSQSRAGFQSLVAVLHAAATARGQPTVLSPAELAAYSSALGARSVAARMALAAELTGDAAEAAFWRRLPATLCALQSTLEAGGSAAAATAQPGAAVPRGAVAVASRAAPSRRRLLWEEGLELAEALERSGWHEQMSRRIFEGSEDLQEKRVLEYVALGDFQTAVGFLLASPPDRSQRYYRDALCVLGMAFACGIQAAGASASVAAAAASAAEDAAARSLFVQAAKVITANAASVGDTLLGVPLLCSTGQHADAASLLQDSGLWRYASALVAHSLRAAERATALERWAGHVAAAEGRPWTAAGLLVAAGALGSAHQMLRQHGMPDAASALAGACAEAGLAPAERGGPLPNLWAAAGRAGQAASARLSSGGERPDSGAARAASLLPGEAAGGREPGGERSEAAHEFRLYVCEVLQQL
ncbi:hypothetical protein ABPG77_001795 [Micractinium sp. CCAP 211/92]